MEKLVNEFNENGFIILKNIFSKEFCQDLLLWLDKSFIEKKYDYYCDEPSIYQNLITNDSPYHKVINNPDILKFLKIIFKNKEFKYNMIKVNNKIKNNGKDIEYHQEFFNQDILHKNNKSNDYIQLFIPITDQNLSNGCLKIIPKSHKLGILEKEEFIDSNFNHKYRVSCKIINKYDRFDCQLNCGDVLIFDSLLIHGSASNKSNSNRLSIVSHVINSKLELDHEQIKERYDYRKNFEIKNLNKFIDNKKLLIKNNNHFHKLI